MQCQTHTWLLISSCWWNEWHNHLCSFPHVFCSGHCDYPLSGHIAPRPTCMPLQWMIFSSDTPPPFQVPTHLLRSSSNVRSSMKHLLRSRWCLIHLSVPSIWHRVTVMKWALKWESAWTEGRSQYPIADKNMGFMVWQTWMHILLLDLHLVTLVRLCHPSETSLVVKWE